MKPKKWLIPGFFLLVILGFVTYALIWISVPSDLPISALDYAACAQWGIAFDSTSVNWIYDDPDSILDDPASFWKEDSAYSLVALAP